tara:strand:- start:13622 stop:13921 length:300 start_codon:yes stop_codon:yes gene_type:complete
MDIYPKALLVFSEETEQGTVEWRWKTEGDPSPSYKSLNYSWWTPKKSDFEILTKLDTKNKQEARDEVWANMQEEIEYFKKLKAAKYKLQRDSKREVKNG